MSTIKQLLRDAIQRLNAVSETAQLDAELLLAHVLNKSRAFLYAHSNDEVPPDLLDAMNILLQQRESGFPVAYLLEAREFWSLPLYVTPSTLIPRPETERLVELALMLFGAKKTCTVLELGTGTGAISAAIATEKPHWKFCAVDKSFAALQVAQKNVERHKIKNIQLLQSDWFQALNQEKFDLIISNPPYLAEDDPHQHQGDLRFEPKTALLSGMDGLKDLKRIIEGAYQHLVPSGLLLLEHGYSQCEAVSKHLEASGYKKVQSWQDAAGHMRVTGGFSAT